MKHTDPETLYPALVSYPEYYGRICKAEQYASTLLPFIPRGLPVFQSHGICHSEGIIRYINQMIRTFPLPLCEKECFLLYLAAWFHDIGYLHPLSIHDRSSHADLSAMMIQSDPVLSDLLSEIELDHLAFLVKFHDSRAELTTKVISSSLRMHLVTALFRLTDAIDLGTDRCPPKVFSLIEDGLDEHSRWHWKAHQNVKACYFHYPSLTIVVYNPEDPFFRRRIVPHLEDDCRSCSPIFRINGVEPCRLVIERSDDIISDISSFRREKVTIQPPSRLDSLQ